MATLIHDYRFEGNGNDSVGTNNGSIFNSVSYTTGYGGGQCLKSGNIGLTTSIDSLFASATARWTITFDLKRVGAGNPDGTFVFDVLGGADPVGPDGRALSGIYFRYDNLSGIDGANLQYTDTLGNAIVYNSVFGSVTALNTWFSLKFDYDYSRADNDRTRIYFNETLYPTTTTGSLVTSLKSIPVFYLGAIDYGVSSPQFETHIDNIKIYQSLQNPYIYNISPSEFVQKNDLLTISGVNLEGSVSTELFIDNVDYTSNIVSSSGSEITFTAPDMSFWTHDVKIVADGYSSNEFEISYVTGALIKHKWNFEKETNDNVGVNHGILTGSYASGGI